MRTAHFKTIMSDDTFMTKQILDVSCYAGQIGQWQNGVPQVIDPGAKRTAAAHLSRSSPGRHRPPDREQVQSPTDRVLN